MMSLGAKRLLGWMAMLLPVVLVAALFLKLSTDTRGHWLHKAASTGQTTKAKLLVWLGTDVNCYSGSGTALHGAAAKGDIELMTFLIQHGAIVDPSAKFGITPLWNARQYHQIAAEQLLLACGANPDTSHIHPP